MKSYRNILASLVIIGLFLPAGAMAAGIELSEQSAVAQGRVLAVKARLDDPSTIFFNVAGLAYMRGLQVAFGDTLVFPDFNYSDPRDLPADQLNSDAQTTNLLVPPPHAYISYGMDLGSAGGLGFGLGFNFPFGLTLVWDEDFAGRHEIQETGLLIPEITLGAAWAPVRQVSFGAAFVVAPASVSMKKYLGPSFGLMDDEGMPIEDAFVEMAGAGIGMGFTAGIQARPIKDLYLGLAYRSRIRIDMEGDAAFSLPGLTDRSAFPDQKVKTAFQLPDILSFGVGYQILERWYAEFDVGYTFWSLFETIPLEFPEDKTDTLSQEIPEHWVDGFVFRFGNEVNLSEHWIARAGIGYDQNPAIDKHLTPMLPDADRIFSAIGGGWRPDFGLTVDLSYQFTYFFERTVTGHVCSASSTESECAPAADGPVYDEDGRRLWVGARFPATYNNVAHLLSITLGWKF